MDDERLKESFLSSQRVYSGKIIDVEQWTVRLPDGKEALREIVLHKGAVAIVPIDADGNVTLVRQHRIAVGRFTWEIPAGKLETADEEPLSAARRELEEETGLHAESWRKLTALETTVGFCNERITVFLAQGLSQHASHPDDDEFLHCISVPLHEAVDQCLAGRIRDGKTIAGLLMAHCVLSGQSTIERNCGGRSSRAAAKSPENFSCGDAP